MASRGHCGFGRKDVPHVHFLCCVRCFFQCFEQYFIDRFYDQSFSSCCICPRVLYRTFPFGGSLLSYELDFISILFLSTRCICSRNFIAFTYLSFILYFRIVRKKRGALCVPTSVVTQLCQAAECLRDIAALLVFNSYILVSQGIVCSIKRWFDT